MRPNTPQWDRAHSNYLQPEDPLEYFECSGCELLIHDDAEVYWDHTEGENGLNFHSEECAISHTISRVELHYGIDLVRK
jgi:hypothetical protein